MRASIYLAFYVGSVVLANYLFAVVPPIATAFGMLSPVALIVGVTFVLRDFAQREAKHYVVPAMALATLASFYLAAPAIAFASAVAFGMGELADYLIYTTTKKPFYKRVLLSSFVSAPVDTIVFLWLIDFLSPGTVMLMVLAKLFAAYAVWYWARIKPDADLYYN